jgi:beta-hydroxylase
MWFMNRIIRALAADGNPCFFDPRQFEWIPRVEAGVEDICGELDAVLEDLDNVPNFQAVEAGQYALTQDDRWKTLVFYAYGLRVEETCMRCPKTVRILKLIPNMKTAMFSILAPGKHIPEHRGLYNGVLRYHLPLRVPIRESACRIRVANEVRSWRKGKSLVFDDSFPHEVWNDSGEYRVVLFVDFVRPLWFPLSTLNELTIWAMSKSAIARKGVEKARRLERKRQYLKTGN